MRYINIHAGLHYYEWNLHRLQRFQQQAEQPVILTLGCSFTNWGMWGVRYPEPKFRRHGYPSYLAEFIDKGTLFNGGVAGASTAAQVLLAKLFQVLKPACVVFQFMDPRRNPMTTVDLSTYQELRNKEVSDDWYSRVRAFYRPCLKHSYKLKLSPELLDRDITYLSELTTFYNCPFIYLVNNYGYPYFNEPIKTVKMLDARLKEREEITSRLHHLNEKLVITKFKGKKFHISQTDSHPNELRQRLTAAILMPYIREIL